MCGFQVRGKTVYLQYSTRNEIVNAGGGGGERPGNCLLVTLENLDVRHSSPGLLALYGAVIFAEYRGSNAPQALYI